MWFSLSGFDLEKKTALIVNGGNAELVGTPTKDIGRYLVASLIHHEASHNKVIRVGYYFTRQAVLALLEKYSGSKFTVCRFFSSAYFYLLTFVFSGNREDSKRFRKRVTATQSEGRDTPLLRQASTHARAQQVWPFGQWRVSGSKTD